MMTYFGAELVNLFQRGENIVFFGELMRFAVIEHKSVNAF